MQKSRAVSPEARAEILRLLSAGELTVAEIAERTGIRKGAIHAINARAGGLRPRGWQAVARWPEPRRSAMARLLSIPQVDPGDVALVAGLEQSVGPRLRALSRPGERSGRDPDAAFDAPTLRAHLRAHIARQIAAFDAALTRNEVADSARVLRDLGGLKRLLDEIDAGHTRSTDGEGGDDGTGPDLPSLRAEIAQRYAGFVGGGAAA
jgi:hypothetical protein